MRWNEVLKGFISNGMPIVIYLGVVFLLGDKDYYIYALLTIYMIFFYLLYRYRNTVISIFKNKWVISAYSVIIVYVSNVYAEKIINHDFLIASEYIKNSSVFFGAFLSIPLTIFLISMFLIFAMGIIYILPFLKWVLPDNLKNLDKSIIFNYFPFLIIGLSLPLEFFSSINDNVLRASLLTDAYSVSDCGPQEKDVLYMRKDKDSCYKIEVNLNPIHYKYAITPFTDKDNTFAEH